MKVMNVIEKRDFIHSHLHQVNEPVINEIYIKMTTLVNEFLIKESEEDIKNGNVITHDSLKQEVQTWRHTK
jgi:hypothetical protein